MAAAACGCIAWQSSRAARGRRGETCCQVTTVMTVDTPQILLFSNLFISFLTCDLWGGLRSLPESSVTNSCFRKGSGLREDKAVPRHALERCPPAPAAVCWMTWRATAAGAAALSHLIVSDALCLVCVAYVLNFPNFVVLFGLACYLSPARPS